MRVTTVLFVHRDFVGRDLPFDKIYFFHKEDEKHIPRVFPSAFVMPINRQTADAVTKIIEESNKRAATHSVHTGASGEYKLRYKAHPFDRHIRDRISKVDQQTIEHILENRTEYLALVPVLFTKQNSHMEESRGTRELSEDTIYPQYLTAFARRRDDDPEKLANEMVGTCAYFIYRGKTYRPLCLLCSRSIDSILGVCRFGSRECYFNLGRVSESDFTRGMRAYQKLVGKIDEPELHSKEVSDVELPRNAD